MNFPGIDEYYARFCRAVKQSGQEQRFLTKWGLQSLADAHDILSNNVQGGFESHRHTMLSGRTGGSILNIGPGMGFCVLLLSELFEKVYVAEPDGDNCLLLEHIAQHYETGQNKNAAAIVKIFHAGISITPKAVRYWDIKSKLMKKRNQGSILNFDIKDAVELSSVFPGNVSRIYLHKVLSSLSIANSFANIIAQCAMFLEAGGEITWSEPSYIFDDILQVGQGDTLENAVKPIFAKNHLDLSIHDYEVTNRDKKSGTVLGEKWTLILSATSQSHQDITRKSANVQK